VLNIVTAATSSVTRRAGGDSPAAPSNFRPKTVPGDGCGRMAHNIYGPGWLSTLPKRNLHQTKWV